MSLRYEDAGVNIQAGDSLVERIKPFAKKTMRSEVLAGIGGFGALFKLKDYRNPVLVSGTDGVGTKLKLAFELNAHDTIGQDLVAMSVNDILVQGAEPLFFLDYFACGKLDVDIAERVIRGIAHACTLAGCSLIGGETAEMPDMYPIGEYDVAGFAVGVVEEDNIISGKNIAAGDAIIGLASSGAHSNGYSLIRKIIQTHGLDLRQDLAGITLAQHLMVPTRIYVPSILQVLKHYNYNTQTIKGLAHITGGGLKENIPRILPANMQAILQHKNWPLGDLFTFLQKTANIDWQEMYTVFNCGIGMVMVVTANALNDVLEILKNAGEQAYHIGYIDDQLQQDEHAVQIV